MQALNFSKQRKIDIEIFPPVYLLSQAISIYISFCIGVNLIHALRIMRIPVVEIRYDDAYVLIDAIKKIISLRIIKKNSSKQQLNP